MRGEYRRVAELRSRLRTAVQAGSDDGDIEQIRHELEAAKAEAARTDAGIRDLVKNAPPLSSRDAAIIRRLLPPRRRRGD